MSRTKRIYHRKPYLFFSSSLEWRIWAVERGFSPYWTIIQYQKQLRYKIVCMGHCKDCRYMYGIHNRDRANLYRNQIDSLLVWGT